MLTHTGEKPHGCDICKKTFTHASSLKNHMFTHWCEPIWMCCLQENFHTGQSWKNHPSVVHNGEKPCYSHLCDKSFKQAKSLKNHILRGNDLYIILPLLEWLLSEKFVLLVLTPSLPGELYSCVPPIFLLKVVWTCFGCSGDSFDTFYVIYCVWDNCYTLRNMHDVAGILLLGLYDVNVCHVCREVVKANFTLLQSISYGYACSYTHCIMIHKCIYIFLKLTKPINDSTEICYCIIFLLFLHVLLCK